MKRLLPLLALALSACASPHADTPGLALPPALEGKVVVLSPSDADYVRANVSGAVKPAGQGGVSQALVVKLSQDLPAYRMWNGPGGNNRLGGWWAFDAPRGTREGYRRAYEICGTWNQLSYVAACTLKQGSVVAIGPGQSVSAETCADASGFETYGANPVAWQVYLNQAWTRTADELICPDPDQDYRADPAEVSRPAL